MIQLASLHNNGFFRWPVAAWAGLVIGLTASLAAHGQQDGETADEAQFDVAIHLASFDKVWQTVRGAHWEPERTGASWDAAREQFRPQVEQATSVAEVRKALNEMLDSLGQSHYGIIPGETYDEIERERVAGGEGTVGLRIRLIDDALVVVLVEPDSPAAAAGIEPGWALTRLANKSADEIIEICRTRAEHSIMRPETVAGLACDARTSGSPGSELAVEFLDNDDQPVAKTLTFARAPGELQTLGNLPPFTVHYESRMLDDEFGYIRFNAFLGEDLIHQYEDSLKEFREQDARGLVLDLRGNRGGIVLLVSGMCGWLSQDRSAIGTMFMARGTELKLVLNPRAPAFDRPVAVLVDECSISAAEMMSGGLRDLGRASVFGTSTAGLVLPSVVVKLPNGDGFQYAMAGYHSANGEPLEGVGVEPTHPVPLTRASFANESDPALEAAKAWLKEQ